MRFIANAFFGQEILITQQPLLLKHFEPLQTSDQSSSKEFKASEIRIFKHESTVHRHLLVILSEDHDLKDTSISKEGKDHNYHTCYESLS